MCVGDRFAGLPGLFSRGKDLMDTIIQSRIIPGHKFVVFCDLATAYNDVNTPMIGSRVITLSMLPNRPNTYLPEKVNVLLNKALKII
ncbi:hypothetical protein MAR_034810 [Mya arenaria]|uniref:Uncharacterized protein n=1 Tax=Mya arenaria TaxID=6604 RepID=A0ABY7EKS6_MYAAR|nr:hypothetical protein MAR_034810 [Mya arenaria]